MALTDICVSLETGKKLQAAGWNKPTHFRYGPPWNSKDEIYMPIAEEILRELPKCVKCPHMKYSSDLEIFVNAFDKWAIKYEPWYPDEPRPFSSNKSLAEAAAQMWLWCVENGYIKIAR